MAQASCGNSDPQSGVGWTQLPSPGHSLKVVCTARCRDSPMPSRGLLGATALLDPRGSRLQSRRGVLEGGGGRNRGKASTKVVRLRADCRTEGKKASFLEKNQWADDTAQITTYMDAIQENQRPENHSPFQQLGT